MKKAVLFDMDGLMFETKLTWQIAEKDFLAHFGKTYDKDIAKRYQGMRVSGVVAVMIAEYQLTLTIEQGVHMLTQSIVDNYQRPDLELLPGCKELVKQLYSSGEYHLAVASSSPKAAIEAMIHKFNFTEYFDELTSGDEVQEGKPSPDIFLECANRLCISPGNCLVLEDAPNGIEAAKRAGMKAVAVYNRSFYTPEDFKGYNADLIVASLNDLSLPIIEKVFRP